MSDKGVITREQIFQQKAIESPIEYAENLKVAIDYTQQLVAVGQQFNQLSKEFKGAKTSKEIITLKSKEVDLQKKQADLITKQHKAELELLKTKEKEVVIETKELNLKNKLEASRRRSIKLSEDEKLARKQTNRALAEEAILNSNLTGAYQKLNLRRTQAKKNLQDLIASGKASNLELERAQNKFDKLDKKVRLADKAVGDFTKNVGNYKSAFGGLTSSLKGFIGAFGYTSGVTVFASLVKNAFTSIREFDKSMQNLSGITTQTRSELKDIEQEIINVAGSSTKTSTEVAQLAESLATLGKRGKELKDLIKPSNDLSIALETTSEKAAEFLVGNLNAFGAGSEEASKYASVIASIRASTSLDFERMNDSFQYVSSINKILGKDLAYTGAQIGILSDNNIKAQSSGRLLGTSLQKIASSGKSLDEVLLELNEAKEKGVEGYDLLALATKSFGAEAAKIGIILSDNIDKIEENAKVIRENETALEDLVNEQLKSLDASLLILKSRWEEFILKENDATGASTQLSKIIGFLSDNLDLLLKITLNSIKGFVAYKAIIYSVRTVKISYKLVTTGLAYAKALLAGNTIAASRALITFRTVLASSGIGLAIVLVGALASSFLALKDAQEEEARSFKESRLERKKLLEKEVSDTVEAVRKKIKIYEIEAKAKGLSDQYIYDNKKKLIEDEIKLLENKRKGDFEDVLNNVKEEKEAKKGLFDEFKNLDVEIDKKALVNKLVGVKALVKKDGINKVEIDIDTDVNLEDEYDKKINGLKELLKEANTLDSEGVGDKKKEDNLKALFDLRVALAEREISIQEKVIDNENSSFSEKIKSNSRLNDELKSLNLLKYNEDKRLLDSSLKDKSISNDEYVTRLKILDLKLIANKEDSQDKITENLKKALEDRLKLAKTEITDTAKNNDPQLEADLNAELVRFRKGETNAKNYQENILNIRKKYALEDLKVQEAKALELLNSSELGEEQKLEILKVYSDLRKGIVDAETENEIDQLKKTEELRRKVIGDTSYFVAQSLGLDASHINDLITGITDGFENESEKWIASLSVLSDVVGSISSFQSELSQRRIDEIDDEIDLNNQYYQNKIDKENLSEEQKTLLENQRQVKEEKLNAKKKKEQKKQAENAKALAILQIILNTSASVIGALAPPPIGLGPLLGIPFAVAAGAVGAVQLATAIATPIPKYAKGVKSKPTDGIALVGEERPEVIIEPNKEAYVVDSPSLLNLPKGTEVVPSIEKYTQMFNNATISDLHNEKLKVNKAQEIKANDLMINEALIAKYINKELSKHQGNIEKEIKKGFASNKQINNIIIKGELKPDYTRKI